MVLPINAIFNSYYALADTLIDEINATTLTLVYNIGNSSGNTGLSQVNSAFSQEVHGELGLPQDTNDLYQTTTSSEDILVRSYQNTGKDSSFPANLRDKLNVYKITCYTSDVPKMVQASYFKIAGTKCKRISDPSSYGFGKRYSTFYIETFSDAG